jgi:hypothetical protein
MCNKRIEKKKQKQELERAKGGDYKEKLDLYTQKAKKLWSSGETPEKIRKKLLHFQKKLGI